MKSHTTLKVHLTFTASDGGALSGGGVGEGGLLADGARDDGAAQPRQGRQRTHQGAQVGKQIHSLVVQHFIQHFRGAMFAAQVMIYKFAVA